MAKKKRRRGRIKIKTGAKLVHRNDATRVAKPDTTRYPRMQAQMPRDVAPTFKIRIRRK